MKFSTFTILAWFPLGLFLSLFAFGVSYMDVTMGGDALALITWCLGALMSTQTVDTLLGYRKLRRAERELEELKTKVAAEAAQN
jgi:hypothetical protein